MHVLISTIVVNAGTQVRAAISETVVAEYAEQMVAGAVFPPVVIFHDGTSYYLADGFHRVMASLRNQCTDIEAELHTGTREDALWYALGANRVNGLRLSHADKRRAAEIALQTWPDRSGGGIAERIGVSRSFVTRLRKQQQQCDLTISPPAMVLGRDGKLYDANPPARRTVPPERIAEVEAALRRGEGVSIIAHRLRMSTRTVQGIRIAASIPGRDHSKGARAHRLAQMREMALAGFTSRQIADKLECTVSQVGIKCRTAGIVVHADEVVGKRLRRHNPNRIIEQMVLDAEHLCADVNLIDFGAIDIDRVPGWLATFQTAREELMVFIRRLMKERRSEAAS
jgi:hypothetical protein